MSRAEFTVNRTGLEFDRDYGIDKRTGWSVVHEGRVMVQFVSLPWAVCCLINSLVKGITR